MVFIGIDPGKSGGISFIDNTCGLDIRSFPYTDENLRKWCRQDMFDYESIFCVVEQVHAMPGQGVTSMFNFGKSFGYILGVLEANHIPYQLVSPQKWKKEFGLDNDKQKSIDCAKRLFPQVNLFLTKRCRKESDGMAESLLMAEWGRRHYEGIKSEA